VTMGPAGAGYVAGPGFSPDPGTWPEVRHSIGASGSSRSGRVPVPGGERQGDPTGCGDVWGATFFARLLAGEGLDSAMVSANRSAARNVEHRGARGLTAHLRGQVSDTIS
jgi:sugar/nucleoside kinase (ribokinase family)